MLYTAPDFPPKDTVGPKVFELSKLMKQQINSALKNEGLFAGQHLILHVVEIQPGITQSCLAKMLGVTPATISVSIKRLEKSGFLTLAPDEKDARITKIYLSEKATAQSCRIREIIEKNDKNITRDMTEEEAILFARLLDTAIATLMNGGDNIYD